MSLIHDQITSVLQLKLFLETDVLKKKVVWNVLSSII